MLSKNTIDTDSTAKDGDEDKFEQDRIEIKHSGGIDCNNNQYNEDNKEVEVEVGTQMKANTNGNCKCGLHLSFGEPTPAQELMAEAALAPRRARRA